MHELAWEALEETVLSHPFVVVDLAQVVAAGLRPDFGAGGVIVGVRVGVVEVLIRVERARDLATEPLGDRGVALRRIAWNRRRASRDFGPVGAQQRDLLR